MNDKISDLMQNGFMIYPDNSGKFIVKKQFVPTNPFCFPESTYSTYLDAFEAAVEMLNRPRLLSWLPIVRYNRGLGIEYKSLTEVLAFNKESAIELAYKDAENVLEKTAVILELKVKLKYR